MPNSYECALFSQLCYKEDGKVREKLRIRAPGWELLASSGPGDTGTKCLAIRNEAKKQLVIAIRGTIVVENWITNFFHLVRGVVPPCYKEVKNFAEKQRRRYHDHTIFITGHSLGAFLAELYTCEVHSLGAPIEAITFESTGCKEAANRMGFENLNQVKILTYLSAPNIINTLYGHLGTIRRAYILHTKSHGRQMDGAEMQFLLQAILIPFNTCRFIFATETNPSAAGLAENLYSLLKTLPYVGSNLDYLKHLHSMDNMINCFDPRVSEPVLCREVIAWPSLSNYLFSSLVYIPHALIDPFSEWFLSQVEVNRKRERRIAGITNYHVGKVIIPKKYTELQKVRREREEYVDNLLEQFDHFSSNPTERREIYTQLCDPRKYRDPGRDNDLLIACERGASIDEVRRLLNDGASAVEAKRDYHHYKGLTALHLAARHGHEHLIDLLVEEGAVVDAEDNYSGTPLLCALYDGFSKSRSEDNMAKIKKTVVKLLRHNANINHSARNWYDSAGKWLAIIFSFGIEEAVAPRRGDHKGWRAIHFISYYTDDLELLQTAIRGGSEIDAKTTSGDTAQKLAERAGRTRIQEHLRRPLTIPRVATALNGAEAFAPMCSSEVRGGIELFPVTETRAMPNPESGVAPLGARSADAEVDGASLSVS